mgnify:FL=1
MIHSSHTIQIVLDGSLLRAADSVAKKEKVNRSALIRAALRDYLERRKERELLERDRRGYLAIPQTESESLEWEEVSAWPE